MARPQKDYKYVTDVYGTNGLPDSATGEFSFVALVRAQEGIDNNDVAGVQVGLPVDIAFHLNLYENRGKFGLHPRYVELRREILGTGGSQCLVQKGEIPKKLVILNPTRFNAIVERNESATPVVEGTQITLNGVTWRVVRKVPERRDENPNPA